MSLAAVLPGGALAPADAALAAAVLGAPGAAQRRAIAKTITLLESTRPDHRLRADALLDHLLAQRTARRPLEAVALDAARQAVADVAMEAPTQAALPEAAAHAAWSAAAAGAAEQASGDARGSFRIGISGVPGVGKSTFIEALGLHLIGAGHRVAVLAVDPSSSISGGSILGDKTRMERLSLHEQAYIRPSPSSGTLGGVAEKTREALLVCEAAGYDILVVETVGVGQSETAVAGMTDVFCLLQLPNAGDDLQAIKKGVMELADLVVINKADLDAAAATRARAQITSALRLVGLHRRGEHTLADGRVWQPQVLQLSALHGSGIGEFWDALLRFRQLQQANGQLAQRRRQQDQAWMWERIDAGLKARFRQHPAVRAALPDISQAVQQGRLAASVAARRLLELLSA